jgi:hypothetical protein
MHTGSGRTLLIARRKQQRGQANKRLSSILQESCSNSLGKGGKLRCEDDHSALLSLTFATYISGKLTLVRNTVNTDTEFCS